MVIAAITPYAVNVILDKQQAAVVAQALAMLFTDMENMEELEYRMYKLGQTSLSPTGVIGAIEQSIDVLCKATGIPPYCEHCCGEGEHVEEDEVQAQEAKPSQGKPN